MIKYYLNTGDQQGSDMVSPYVWGEHGFGSLIDRELSANSYGSKLELLLVQYYIEGKFSTYLPENPKVGNYLINNKNIAVAVGVSREAFHFRDEFERRKFIVNSTLNAVELVKKRLLKKKLSIDFERLQDDLVRLSKNYFAHPTPYWILRFNPQED